MNDVIVFTLGFEDLAPAANAAKLLFTGGSSVPPIIPMAVALLATNARYLVMGAHLYQIFGRLKKRLTLPILFLLADASWLMTTADAENNEADVGYLLGASVPMAVGWMGGTAVGYGLPLAPGGPLSVAASLLPAAFIVTLLPTQWRGARSVLPWLLSAAGALLVGSWVSPNWAMLAGGAVGTSFSMMRADHG